MTAPRRAALPDRSGLLVPKWLTRTIGVLLGLLLLWFGVGLFLASWVHPLTADRIERLDSTYTVQADGSVKVREEVTIRFGLRSGRHGLARDIKLRAPQGRSHDLEWPVRDIRASSPSGHSAQVHTDRAESADGRTEVLWIRLGDPDTRIASDTASYVLEYTQEGLVRPTDSGNPEFSLNGGGPRMWATNITARVITPQPPVQSGCWVTLWRCGGQTTDGRTTTATIERLWPGQQFTVAAQTEPGAMRTNVNRWPGGPGSLAAAYFTSRWLWIIPTVIIAAISWGIGRLRAPRTSNVDDRYANLAPGTLPKSPSSAPTVPDRGVEIPVRFSPPEVNVVEAGYLLDEGTRPRHLAAALMHLAAQGALRLEPAEAGGPATLVKTSSNAHGAPFADLLNGLFGKGDRVRLDDDRVVLAYATMADGLERKGKDEGWLIRPEGRYASYRTTALNKLALRDAEKNDYDPNTGLSSSSRRARPRQAVNSVLLTALGTTIGLGFLTFLISKALPFAVIIGPIAAFLMGFSEGHEHGTKAQHTRRSAAARALTDQVEGFRTYLRTAESGQLKLAEADDLYTAYLPWAVLFGCADRWAKVCQQAIGDGMLPEPQFDVTSSLAALSSTTGDLDRGMSHTFAALNVERDWTPPKPTTGLAGWLASDSSGSGGGDSSFSSGGGSGSGGSGGSFGSW